MITIKIYKDGYKREQEQRRWTGERYFVPHDKLVLRTIARMRKLGMIMIRYNEASYKNYMLMKFEKRKGEVHAKA
jgi:hypothetical protein